MNCNSVVTKPLYCDVSLPIYREVSRYNEYTIKQRIYIVLVISEILYCVKACRRIEMENGSNPSNSIVLMGQKNFVTFKVKLDGKNFLLWKQQVIATINGHDFEAFVVGETTIPTKTSSDYQMWHKQDQLLLS